MQIEVPELDGGLRGKLVSLDKGLGGEVGFSNILYGLSTVDDVYLSPFSSYENGFADIYRRPHLDTLRRLSWRPDTVAVMVDMHDPDGRMTPECPRTMLRRAAAKAAAMGFEPRIAVEYECYIYYADETVETPSPATMTLDTTSGARMRRSSAALAVSISAWLRSPSPSVSLSTSAMISLRANAMRACTVVPSIS